MKGDPITFMTFDPKYVLKNEERKCRSTKKCSASISPQLGVGGRRGGAGGPRLFSALGWQWFVRLLCFALFPAFYDVSLSLSAPCPERRIGIGTLNTAAILRDDDDDDDDDATARKKKKKKR